MIKDTRYCSLGLWLNTYDSIAMCIVCIQLLMEGNHAKQVSSNQYACYSHPPSNIRSPSITNNIDSHLIYGGMNRSSSVISSFKIFPFHKWPVVYCLPTKMTFFLKKNVETKATYVDLDLASRLIKVHLNFQRRDIHCFHVIAEVNVRNKESKRQVNYRTLCCKIRYS